MFAANILSLQEKSLGFPGDHSLALPAASPTYVLFAKSTCNKNICDIANAVSQTYHS